MEKTTNQTNEILASSNQIFLKYNTKEEIKIIFSPFKKEFNMDESVFNYFFDLNTKQEGNNDIQEEIKNNEIIKNNLNLEENGNVRIEEQSNLSDKGTASASLKVGKY